MFHRTKKSTHYCTLKRDYFFDLPRLPPNATCCKKFIRWLRKFTLLDTENEMCKDYFRNRSGALMERRRHIRSKYSHIIHPMSAFSTWRERIICTVWIATFFIGPFKNAFYSKRVDFSAVWELPFGPIEIVVDILLFLNFVLLFLTGYVVPLTKEIIMEPKRIARNYMKYLLFDFFGYMHVEYYVAKIFPTASDLTLELVAMLIHLRFVRIITVKKYFQRSAEKLGFREPTIVCTLHMILTGILVHFWACMLYTVPHMVALYYEELDERSWIKVAHLEDASLLQKYVQCLYLTVSHFYGAGGGNYTIQDLTSEELLCSLILISGRLYTLFMMGHVLHIFGIVRISKSAYEEMQKQFRDFTMSKRLPKALRDRVNAYYIYKYKKHYFNSDEIRARLSEHLRDEVNLHRCQQLINTSHMFRFVPKSAIGGILRYFNKQIFLPDDFVLSFNEPIEQVYLIASGSVGIFNKDGIELIRLYDGDAVGASAIISNARYEFTSRTIEVSELFVIDAKTFLMLLHDMPEVANFFNMQFKQKLTMMDRINTMYQKQLRLKQDVLIDIKSGKVLENRQMRTKHRDR